MNDGVVRTIELYTYVYVHMYKALWSVLAPGCAQGRALVYTSKTYVLAITKQRFCLKLANDGCLKLC